MFSRSEKYSNDEERKHPVPQSFSNSAIQSISKTGDKAIIPGESLRANAGSERNLNLIPSAKADSLTDADREQRIMI